MAEFTSEPRKAFNPIKLYIIGILVVVLGTLLLIGNRYCGSPLKTDANTVDVPGLLVAGDTNFEYYKQRIRIENPKAVLGISLNSSRNASITGILVNDGDRKLEAVRLHVTLYDKYGKVSKERTAFALRPGMGLSPRPMEPLEKRQFAIGVDSVEVMWDPKKIEYEITGLKYQ
jgi:hypothetical protein